MAHDLAWIAKAAESAARQAGQVVLSGRASAQRSISAKRSIMDIVTAVDREAERVVVETIREAFPDDAVVGEEGSSFAGRTGRRWLVDPLDGTVNYARGWRVAAVSIGVEIDGLLTIGVVHNPLQDETFTAVRGHGACLNGDRLGAVPDVPWNSALIGVDGGFDAWARQERSEIFRLAAREAGDARTSGSAALALCYTAIGRFTAYSATGCSGPWDIAAGTVVAREVGLLVEGMEPGSAPTPERTLVAPQALMPQLRALIQRAIANSAT